MENNDKKLQARSLYFQSDLNQTQIAELLDINRKTLYLWIEQGAWKEAKKAAKNMPAILVGQYYNQLGRMNEMIAQREERPYPTREEAEIMRKLTLCIAQTTRRLGPNERIEEMTLFLEDNMKEDQPFLHRMARAVDKYVHDTMPTDIITGTRKRYYEDKAAQQQEQQIANLATCTAPGSSLNPENPGSENNLGPSSSQSPSPSGEGWGGVGASSSIPQNPTQPATEATITDPIHTLPMPQPREEENGQSTEISSDNQDNTSFPWVETITLPVFDGERSYIQIQAIEPSPGWHYLNQKYDIAHDPYVTFKNGIYCIRHGSPLWGLNRSLF